MLKQYFHLENTLIVKDLILTVLAPSICFQLFQDFCAGLMTCLLAGIEQVNTPLGYTFLTFRIFVTSYVEFQVDPNLPSQKQPKLLAWVSEIDDIKWTLIEITSQTKVLIGNLAVCKGI